MEVFADIRFWTLAICSAIGFFAGVIKGSVGFAMPLVLYSGMSVLLPLELTLAGLILPILVTNILQALRGGLSGLGKTLRRYWRLVGLVMLFIALSSQLVVRLPAQVLYAIIGVPVVIYAVLQLVGWRLVVRPENRVKAEVLAWIVSGFFGGISGIWGPPVVAFLSATNTPKTEHVRVQGIVYGMGAVVLFLAHLRSGVLSAYSAPFSAWLLVPSIAGLGIGMAPIP